MTALRRTSVGCRSSCSRSVRSRSPPGIARMLVVHLLVELLPGDRDLLGVHHDDEVAGVDVRREGGLALPAQAVGDLRGDSAQGLPLGVHEIPVARDLTGLGVVSLHTEKGRTDRPPGANRSSPSRNSASPPWDWMPDVRGAQGARREPADGDHPAAVARAPRRTGGRLRPRRRVGRRLDRSVPGWVGTTFQSSTWSARPSSASTRCTIVAVASAGPRPVSCRSEVNGIPETRAPR